MIQAVNRKIRLVRGGKELAEKIRQHRKKNTYMFGSRKDIGMLNFSMHSYFIYNVTTEFDIMKMQREICVIHLTGEISTNRST